MIEVDEFMTFLEFSVERHSVWEKRNAGLSRPWTKDPILRDRKFTNVFRAIDYGSQFLIKNLLDPEDEPEDVLMRCFLYRHTNLPSAWEAYAVEVGGYPGVADLDDLREFWKKWRDENGQKVFSGAYMIYPQSATPGTDKVDSIIDLTKRLFEPGSTGFLVPEFLEGKTLQEQFAVLRRNKGVADFMSMQILTDWGYSDHCGEDRENEWVMPGPGSRKGCKVIDPDVKAENLLPVLQESLWNNRYCPELELPNGGYRKPSLLDTQNLTCEYSKYVRHRMRVCQGKPSPQRPYQPAHDTLTLSSVQLPAHWNR